MVNRHRGEITARLDGRDCTLCLTLSALANLEHHLRVTDLPGLAERLGSGTFSADDLVAILHAGLVGGGHDIDRQAVGEMRSDAGSTGYALIVSELLVASFGSAKNALPDESND